MRRNGWKTMRDEIVEMQRAVVEYIQENQLDPIPPDVELLRRNLHVTRQTLETLWTQSEKPTLPKARRKRARRRPRVKL